MALSALEQSDVIFYLGWPGKTLVTGSTDYSKIIADSLINLNAGTELRVRGLLERIRKMDLTLEKAITRLSAKEVGDIVLRDDEMYQLRRERKKLLRELSNLLDIELLGSDSSISVCV